MPLVAVVLAVVPSACSRGDDEPVGSAATSTTADDVATAPVATGDPGEPATPVDGLEAGQCVADPDTGALTAVDCERAAAVHRVTAVGDGPPDCPAGTDATHTWTPDGAGPPGERHACLRRLIPTSVDGVLEVGSCLQLLGGDDAAVELSERDCGDPAATHEVVAGVEGEEVCPEGTHTRLAKTDLEAFATGPGEWCAVPR